MAATTAMIIGAAAAGAQAIGSIAQAQKQKKLQEEAEVETAKALAIYKDSILIGYTLIRSYDDTYCIDQFAIDKEYQNRGYGKSSFKMILDGLRDERRFEKVTLCHYDNSILSRFYENFGFRFSDMDEDEIILVLDLEK